jgi:hypothetical protein
MKHQRLLLIWIFFLLFKGKELRLFGYQSPWQYMIGEKSDIFFSQRSPKKGDYSHLTRSSLIISLLGLG